ncbi:hypothetical protein H9L14_06950 [Sphingomonas sediminicola]|uniref:DUF937 domain-containing protein n=1 Tax=Sphingomonas sediminicola TaxID=386874 RepID=A0ABX6TAA3_9SPHN|nr:hypothetical protein [Sphingomonas sediminicola]QNP46781.1 hypothetical protein H9L14_06950 [Sphingomonas sediminicola]
MQRAANDVMQSIVFSAVLDAVAALKSASGGLPNQLLRDVQAIHPNVTFADLPKALQDAIVNSTRSAFTQLLKEGYAVGPRQQMQAQRPMDRVPERDRRVPNDRRTVRHGQGGAVRHDRRGMGRARARAVPVGRVAVHRVHASRRKGNRGCLKTADRTLSVCCRSARGAFCRNREADRLANSGLLQSSLRKPGTWGLILAMRPSERKA